MQDQGKRLLLAVALALGVLFLWNTFTHKEEPPKDQAGSAETAPKPQAPQVGMTAGSSTTDASGAPAGAAPSAGSAAKPAEELPRPPEEVITLPFDKFVATFSSYCGGIKSWRLTDKRDATRGQMLPEKSELRMADANGKPVPVPAEQLVNVPDCGAFDVNFASSTFVVPRHAVWKSEKRSDTEVSYSFASDQLDIVKTFKVVPNDFLVHMTVKVGVRVPEGTRSARFAPTWTSVIGAISPPRGGGRS